MIISGKLRSAIRLTSRLLLLVWAGAFSSFAIYYLVAHYACSPAARESTPLLTDPVTFLLGVSALISLLAALAARWFVFSRKRVKMFLASDISEDSKFYVYDLSPDEDKLCQLAKATFQPYLLGLCFVHSCAVFGMMLAILRHDEQLFLPFLAAACFVHLLFYPCLHSFVEDAAMVIVEV